MYDVMVFIREQTANQETFSIISIVHPSVELLFDVKRGVGWGWCAALLPNSQ